MILSGQQAAADLAQGVLGADDASVPVRLGLQHICPLRCLLPAAHAKHPAAGIQHLQLGGP